MEFNQSFYGGKNCSVFGSGSGRVFPVSMRDAENSNGMRDLTAHGEAGFTKIRTRLRHWEKSIFGIAMTELRDEGF